MTAAEADIPVVDLSFPNASEELLSAASMYGFIYIKHHGLPVTPEDVSQMFKVSQDFFQSPLVEKEASNIKSTSSGKNTGYLPMHSETLDPKKKGDFKECFNISDFDADGKPSQSLPALLSSNESIIASFQENCHKLCNQILRLIAVALKIPEAAGGTDWFAKRHDRSLGHSGSILRLLYYPKLPPSLAFDPEQDIRAGAHSDYGSVTLLFRLPSQPGLEIQTPAGDWAPVAVKPEPSSHDANLPVLVNIGDLMSYWTNGLLKSTVHRVTFPKPSEGAGDDRYTIAYFCHPQDDADLEEIPSEVIREKTNGKHVQLKADSKIVNAGEYLTQRLTRSIGVKEVAAA